MTGYLKTTILLAALSLAACASNPTPKQTLNEQGVSAMQAGNMPEAEKLLTQAVQENPNDLKALYNLGTLYKETNRPDQAREYYQRVIDSEAEAVKNGMDPNEAAQLVQMAHDSIAQMDSEEAKRLEALKPKAPEPPVQTEPAQVQVVPVVQESGYQIQTGAYAIIANAQEMQDKLMGRYASLISGKHVSMVKIGGLTKVRIGPYSTKHEADNACKSLKRAGVDCFRVR